MNKVGIIYKATSPSGKIYIGQTIRKLSIRINRHNQDSKDRRYNTKFSRAIRKYGIEKFMWEILYDNILIDQLNDLEIKTIAEYDSYNHGYNSNIGGGSNYGFHPTPEQIEKRAKKIRGRKMPKSFCQKVSKALKGIKFGPRSEETKKRMSECKKGKKNPMFGKHRSKTTRAKSSRSLKEFWTEEKKMKIRKTGAFNSAKLTWEIVREIRRRYSTKLKNGPTLAKEYGIDTSHLYKIINNKTWIET